MTDGEILPTTSGLANINSVYTASNNQDDKNISINAHSDIKPNIDEPIAFRKTPSLRDFNTNFELSEDDMEFNYVESTANWDHHHHHHSSSEDMSGGFFL